MDMSIPGPDNIVLQTFDDDRYCSGLLGGRYQIMASAFYEGQYTVFDHKKQDIIRNKSGDFFQMFNSVQEAERFIGIDANSAPEVTNKKPSVANSAKIKTSKYNSAPKSVKMVAKTSTRKRGESPLGYLKELLRTNSDADDKTIATLVQARYPECTYNHSMVKYNRKKMYGG